ncbi:MAG: FAD-dependent oxidoreductase, partial [Verrucomicrobiota bacterium]
HDFGDFLTTYFPFRSVSHFQEGGMAEIIQQKIAILGGGFAGVYCGKRLSALQRRIPECGDTALIAKENYMVFQPMLAEVAGASLSPRHVINPIRRLCSGINVYKGDIESVDLENRLLKVDTGSFSADVWIQFEHLVVSLGSEIDLSRVPGMPEHALLMQNVGDAMMLRSTIISRLEEALAERRSSVRKRLLTFVVVGGGYSGTETAGEALDLLRGIAKYYKGIDRDEIRVILVHSQDRILNTLSDDLGNYAQRKLRERGLEIILGDKVRAVSATRVYLSSGEVIETNTVVSTVGNAPNRVIRDLCDRYQVPHTRYRIQTDEAMRVPGFDFLWAAGDCAAVPLRGAKEEGVLCPQTAQFAMRQGGKLADNLAAEIEGRPAKPFTFQGLGEMASIGHQSAVASVMGFRFSGLIAWLMWRTVYLMKLPGLDRKLRVVIDWTLDLFFPRDMNLLDPRYSKQLRHVHLEPGDRLFTKGDPAFSLYVVKSGKIEMRDGEDVVVRTIETGEYFGERALVHGGGYRYDAIAPESTQLISVSDQVILPFFESSDRFRRVLQKTTAQGSAEDEMRFTQSMLHPEVLQQPVSDVMQTDVATLRPDQTIEDAIQLFRTRRHSVYPLVSQNQQLLGVVERDAFFDCMKRGDFGPNDHLERLERLEIAHLPTCHSGASVAAASEQMVRGGEHKCLVTDADNHLVGVFTVMDLLADPSLLNRSDLEPTSGPNGNSG